MIACIRYVEISVRSATSAWGGIVGSGRESRRTGKFEGGTDWADTSESGTLSKASRRACMLPRKGRVVLCYFTVELNSQENSFITHHLQNKQLAHHAGCGALYVKVIRTESTKA